MIDKEGLRKDLEELLSMEGEQPGIAIFRIDGKTYHVMGEVSDFDILLIAWAALDNLVSARGRAELSAILEAVEFCVNLDIKMEKLLKEAEANGNLNKPH